MRIFLGIGGLLDFLKKYFALIRIIFTNRSYLDVRFGTMKCRGTVGASDFEIL